MKDDHLLRKNERFIIATLFRNQTELTELTDIEVEEVREYAKKNGLAPLLFKVLAHQKSILATHFKGDYLASLVRNERLINTANHLLEGLALQGIRVMPLKGVYLSQYIYADVSTRPMSDIDILVPLKDSKKAYEWLIHRSERSSVLNPDMDPSDHHYPEVYVNQFNVELHRSLFPLNSKYNIPVEDIWTEARSLTSDSFICQMNACQLLIYLALHAYYTYQRGGLRMSWFYDLLLLLDVRSDEMAIAEIDYWLDRWLVAKPFHIIMSQLAFLQGESNSNLLAHFVNPKFNRDVNQAIVYFRESKQHQNTVLSYQLMWERIGETPGLFNKMKFAWHQLMKNRKSSNPFYFVWFLGKRLVKVLFNSGRMVLAMIFKSKSAS